MRKQHQLIVMYPDGIIWISFFDDCFAKFLIYPHIGIPMVRIVNHVLSEIVECRPKCFVTETFIKLLHIFFGQKNRSHFQLMKFEDDFCALLGIVDRISRPAYPDIFSGFIDRVKPCGQTSCTWFKFKFAVAVTQTNGQSIGYYDGFCHGWY